ncbi:hypothetical protein PV779_60580 [Streptomyces sp. ID01-9D]|nr:hypothetical protein [Streptomyces sp. ID01-9D]
MSPTMVGVRRDGTEHLERLHAPFPAVTEKAAVRRGPGSIEDFLSAAAGDLHTWPWLHGPLPFSGLRFLG